MRDRQTAPCAEYSAVLRATIRASFLAGVALCRPIPLAGRHALRHRDKVHDALRIGPIWSHTSSMPPLGFIRRGKREFPERPLIQAHFQEVHYVDTARSWDDAASRLVAAFPMDTRPERPKDWYRLLAGTHWPGQVPPGNGPFYVPGWSLGSFDKRGRPDEAAEDRLIKALKGAGLKEVVAHGYYLPETSEYLAAAMRMVGNSAWTVNPRTYRLYLYPSLRSWAKKPLRAFNTERWRP